MKRSLLHFIPLMIFSLLAVVAAIALSLTLSGERKISQLPSALIGKPLPDTELAELFGNDQFVRFDAQPGRPYLVNFFASWCAPCRAEAPALAKLAEQIEIIGIAYKDLNQDTKAFLNTYGNPYRQIGMDRDGQAGLKWGVYGVPETYLISAEGNIILRHAGPVDADILKNLLIPEIEKQLQLSGAS